MSLNNNYLYPILVSIESIIFNLNKMKTFITIHLLCSPDIKRESLKKLKSLIYQSYNIEIIFYNMGKNFIKYKKKRYSSITFYRILIPLFIDVNRIIYLDGDTLTLKDLSEIYLTNLHDNYVLGFLDYSKISGNKNKEIRSNKYINGGVLLLNLNKIRNDNKIFDLINFTINNTLLPKHDQTIINYVFYPKIGRLPNKYGIWNFPNKLDIIRYSKRVKQKMNVTDLEESMKDIGILHNVKCYPKIWYSKYKYTFIKIKGKRIKNMFKKFHYLWKFYAKKTFIYYIYIKYQNTKIINKFELYNDYLKIQNITYNNSINNKIRIGIYAYTIKNGGRARITCLLVNYFYKIKIFKLFLFTKQIKQDNEYIIPKKIKRIIIKNNLIYYIIKYKIKILIYQLDYIK